MDAYVFDAWRTPRGRGKAEVGGLSMLTPLQLASGLLKQIPRVAVDELILGCVTQTGEQGGCIARTAVLDAGWPQTIPAFTVNRFCASGLEAVNLAAAKVAGGGDGLVLAGGVESMSRVPMGSDGGAWLLDARVVREQAFVPQGIGADLIATREGFSREALDAWALRSHQRAAAAAVKLTPLNALQHDECVRPGTTLEGLAALQPSFAKMGAAGADALALTRYPDVTAIEHRHHAGNSSAIADGAALVLVGSRAAGEAAGLQPRARIRALASVGSEPTIMLTGPAPAVTKALARAGMTAADVDLWEINEAFAAVPLQVMRALELDPERVNVNGGAIALGHPLGATGAMLLGTVLDELERRGLATACVTLCVGGGMGTATLIERC
jgi:acetyl-CoA C-acetyltransferase